jgi:uncharacterized cupin superfamily protein
MADARLDIGSVLRIAPDAASKFVPSLSDYATSSPGWTEAEYHCVDLPASRISGGYWTGEPGSVEIDPWVYTEVCSIISGRVAIVDLKGGRLEFGPGEAFVIPKGFAGEWITLESATKIFLAIS